MIIIVSVADILLRHLVSKGSTPFSLDDNLRDFTDVLGDR
jgi:hypothetical protein